MKRSKWAIRIFYIFAALSILIYALQCKDNTISDDRGSLIYGTITDSLSGSPLIGWVGTDSTLDTLLGFFVFADSEGYYTYRTLLRSGQLYCGCEGYITQSRQFVVAWGDSVNVDFELESR